MNLQYISDTSGQTTGVFIPIEEWNALKRKFRGIEKEEISIPCWHKDLVCERMEEYKSNPGEAIDFDPALDEIENEL